jgi:hypothetical protein
MVNTEDKDRCDSFESDSLTNRRASQWACSLSADSTSEYTDRFSLDCNINNYQNQRSREEPYQPKTVRENSFLTAMGNLPYRFQSATSNISSTITSASQQQTNKSTGNYTNNQ